jgi:cytoskeletal protein RodZ
MATHVALAGLSLSSMSGRLLLLAVLLVLVALLLVKRMHDARGAVATDEDHGVEPSEDETAAEHVDPRSLVSQVSASQAAPVAAAEPAAAAAPVPDAPAPAVAEPVSAVATAERPAAPVPAQPAPVAATRPTPPPAAPTAPVAPARPAGLFAPVPDSAIASGGRAPGATIVPKF